jgi:hypothetical protein
MTSYTIQQHTSPIYIQAFNKEGFNINKYTQLLKKLNANSDQNYPYINGILKLIASSEIEPLEIELACTALTFLLRLINREGMARDFIKVFLISLDKLSRFNKWEPNIKYTFIILRLMPFQPC